VDTGCNECDGTTYSNTDTTDVCHDADGYPAITRVSSSEVACDAGYNGNDIVYGATGAYESGCTLNQCTCNNGVGATGIACPTTNTAVCVACSAGYTLTGGACVTKGCGVSIGGCVKSVCGGAALGWHEAQPLKNGAFMSQGDIKNMGNANSGALNGKPFIGPAATSDTDWDFGLPGDTNWRSYGPKLDEPAGSTWDMTISYTPPVTMWFFCGTSRCSGGFGREVQALRGVKRRGNSPTNFEGFTTNLAMYVWEKTFTANDSNPIVLSGLTGPLPGGVIWNDGTGTQTNPDTSADAVQWQTCSSESSLQ